MNVNDFYKYIKEPNLLNAANVAELQEVLAVYPYFQSAHFLYLKSLYNQQNFKFNDQLKASSVHIPNRKSLLFFIKDQNSLLPLKDDKNLTIGLIPMVENSRTDAVKPVAEILVPALANDQIQLNDTIEPIIDKAKVSGDLVFVDEETIFESTEIQLEQTEKEESELEIFELEPAQDVMEISEAFTEDVTHQGVESTKESDNILLNEIQAVEFESEPLSNSEFEIETEAIMEEHASSLESATDSDIEFDAKAEAISDPAIQEKNNFSVLESPNIEIIAEPELSPQEILSRRIQEILANKKHVVIDESPIEHTERPSQILANAADGSAELLQNQMVESEANIADVIETDPVEPSSVSNLYESEQSTLQPLVEIPEIKVESSTQGIKVDTSSANEPDWLEIDSVFELDLKATDELPVSEIQDFAQTSINESRIAINQVDSSDSIEFFDFDSLSASLIVDEPTAYFEERTESTSANTVSDASADDDAKLSFEAWLNYFKKPKTSPESEKKSVQQVTKKKQEKTQLIDRFLEDQSPKVIRPKVQTDPINETSNAVEAIEKTQAETTKMQAQGLMTETLAKIYIKQGHYDKAIEAYLKLISKHPQHQVQYQQQINWIEDLKK